MPQPQRVCVLWLLLFAIYTLPAHAQQLKVSGTVLHPDKKTPVAGAGIVRLSSGTGTITDEAGRFSLLVQPHDSILVRAVGFRPVLYQVKPEQGTAQQLLFVLQEEVQQIREVEVRSAPLLVKRPTEQLKPTITPPPPVPPRPPTLLFNPVSYFSKEGRQRRKLRKYLTREEERRQQQEAERLRLEQEQQRQNYNRFFKDNTGYR
ncbi:carboxypeptidase-like regulatory domain-containing protein [Pontibacter flavimaris]|uniref:carboxypeptidase-like regulatory domain-containing protein n=1 Tax=Pontibacter flavimaris TaxID=1797110 RepID=UPI00093F0E19|nr:carboxypeptidase-like regulatory domain-containing protein [Pontibacter flavimaris]